MKKTVLTFGLIAGAVLSAMMLLTIPFMDRIGYDRGEILGYTTMVLAFLLVFFGVRSYRDNVAGGTVGFGRAFAVGALIVVVAAVCYVATWQLIYYVITPDFGTQMVAHAIAEARASGGTPAEIAEQVARIERYAEWFRNPVLNAAVAFIEPLPVGLVISLVSAGILSRRRPAAETGLAAALG